jgi:uncharacterized protein YndB with AHSA1/START domain
MTPKGSTERRDARAEPKPLTLTRTLDAPRERIFRAWSSGPRIAKWWGPDGFTTPRCEVEFRTGGAIRIDMRGPDGTLYPMRGTFREVTPYERIVFVGTPLDAEGRELFEVLNSLSFTEQDGRTVVEFTAKVLRTTPEAAPYLQGMEIGWQQQLVRLGSASASEAGA